MERLRRSLSPSMIVALIALSVSLTGGAYAATKLAKNSVGTEQLKQGAVTSAKVENGSIKLTDITPNGLGALDGKDGAQGPQGPQGPQGLQGPRGATGSTGSSGVVVVTRVRVSGVKTSATYTAANQILLVGNIGSPTTSHTNATLRVTFTTQVPAAATGCVFQLRVNGVDSAGNSGSVYTPGSAGVGVYSAGTATPIALDAVFTNVAAGAATVGVYAYGVNGSSTCAIGSTTVPGSLVIEEYSANADVTG